MNIYYYTYLPNESFNISSCAVHDPKNLNQNLNRITSAYLHSKTGHLHPQTVCKSLQASLGHTVGPHVQAGEEGEDAGGVNHPTCSEAQAQLKITNKNKQESIN